jgi:hypothetical protein
VQVSPVFDASIIRICYEARSTPDHIGHFENVLHIDNEVFLAPPELGWQAFIH